MAGFGSFDGGPGLGGGYVYPGAGVGGGVNLDVNGGIGGGLGGLGGLGGFPGAGFAGWGGPYVPITPLGALAGIKGDLIIPIVAVGVAIFLFILIVLAVKFALAWKISLLQDLAGAGHRNRRDVDPAPAPQLADDRLAELAKVVTSAIYSEGCSERVLCELGSYARTTKELPALLRMVKSILPKEYLPSEEILRTSAEGSFSCADKYPCGNSNNATNATTTTQSNDIPKPPTSSFNPSSNDIQ